MTELIFAVFDSPPIACEGDDVNAEIVSKIVEDSEIEHTINNTINDSIVFWESRKV